MTGQLPAIAINASKEGIQFAAVAAEGGEVRLMKRGVEWELIAKVQLPLSEESAEAEQPAVVALSGAPDHLMVSASDGATYRWELEAGLPISTAHRDAPAATEAYAAVGSPRSW